MVAIFFPPSQQPNSASTTTSSHQTSFSNPNLPDPRLITQYGEARRCNPLDAAEALPDTRADEGSKKSAEVSKKKKGKRRKGKKFGAKCGVLPEESCQGEDWKV